MQENIKHYAQTVGGLLFARFHAQMQENKRHTADMGVVVGCFVVIAE